jgi:hypothetical protein
MLGKSRTLALALATAGAIGFGAPMASAATTSIGAGDNGGWSGIGHIQVPPIQICNNNIPINAIVIQAQKGYEPGAPDPSSPGSSTSSPGQKCFPSSEQGNQPWLGDSTGPALGDSTDPTLVGSFGPAADPPADDNGGWPGDNGGWPGDNHNHVPPIQICNNNILINVVSGQKHEQKPGYDTMAPDPTSGETTGKPTIILKNSCQQFNG